MFDEAQQRFLTRTTKTIQIIAFALIMGVIVFAAVIVAGGLAQKEPPETPVIAIVAAVFALGAVVAAAIVPKLVGSAMRKSLLEGKPIGRQGGIPYPEEVGVVGPLAGMYQTQRIIGWAFLEGAAFFNLVAYIIEAQPMCLGFAAFLLIAMFFRFPTRDHLENWIRDEMSTIEQLKSLGD